MAGRGRTGRHGRQPAKIRWRELRDFGGLTVPTAVPYSCGMGDASAIHELTRHVAVLEERMKTMQAEYCTDIANLARHLSDQETRRTDRDATSRWWQTAILSGVIAAVGAIVTAIILAAG